MQKIHLMTLLLAATIMGCGQKSPEQSLADARQFQAQGNHKAAIVELKSSLQEQPDVAEARMLLGISLFRSGDLQGAEVELDKARKLGAPADQLYPVYGRLLLALGKPQRVIDEFLLPSGQSLRTQAEMHALRANAYLALRQTAAARTALEEATKLVENHPEVLLSRARMALLDGHPDQANTLIDAALRLDVHFIDALYLKASLLEAAGKGNEAVKIFQQIVAQDGSEFRAYLAQASQYLRTQDLPAAEKSIQAAEKVAPDVSIVRYARALYELRSGRLKEANEAVLQILRAAPDHAPSLLLQATVSYGLGNYEQSRLNAERVLAQLPDNLQAAKLLASSLIKLGDIPDALKVVTERLARHPKDPQLMALAGEAYLHAKDYLKASQYLDQATELAPGEVSFRSQLASAHMAMGEREQALTELERAARQGSKPGQADLSLIMAHLQSKAYDKALEAIAVLEKKLPNNPLTYNLRATALMGKHDRTAARQALEKALAIEPAFVPAAMNLARLEMQEKRFDKAKQHLESVLKHDANNVKAMLALADLAAAEKREHDYVRWLEKAAKHPADSIEPAKRLVQYHLIKNNYKQALAMARNTVDSHPQSSDALDLLGITQIAAGDLDGAVGTFTQLTQMDEEAAGAYLRLAQAQAARKRLPEARAALEQALKLQPDFIDAEDTLLKLELLQNNLDAALAVARQMQTRHPKSAIGHEREADILLAKRQAGQAIKAYGQALARQEDAAIQAKLYRAMVLSGDVKGAEQKLQSWVQRHPSDTGMRLLLADHYVAGRRNRKAIAQYEAILQHTPNQVVALNNLAMLYQKEKDKRVLATAQRVLKLAPQEPGVQDTVGWILLEQGQLPQALSLLRSAAAKAPQTPSIRYHYAVALVRSGKKAEARKELQAALSTRRPFAEVNEAKALLSTL